MSNQKIENDFASLGKLMVDLAENLKASPYHQIIEKAQKENPWFTEVSIQESILAIGNSLKKENVTKWLNNYQLNSTPSNKKIGLVLAGNIPLVGLHDILCTLASGNIAIAKLSSKDQHLYGIIKNLLIEIDPTYANKLIFTDENINDVDAIVATGSDNNARYFEYYFSKYPHIIRKNRNSMAIINGNETTDELEHLAKDIFSYFGLGCRNVSFLMLPEGFNTDKLFKAFTKYEHVIQHNKYANNYDYQKAIMLLNLTPFLDNGMVLLKEDPSLSSPIGVVHYQFYNNKETITNYIEAHKHKIQCIVSKTNWDFSTYELGEAQSPELWDYADNVDTMEFLLNLK